MDQYLLGEELSEFTDEMKRFLHEGNKEELDYVMGVQVKLIENN
jgi:hypothetical protein